MVAPVLSAGAGATSRLPGIQTFLLPRYLQQAAPALLGTVNCLPALAKHSTMCVSCSGTSQGTTGPLV